MKTNMTADLINFCNEALGTKIFCNQVSSEGYEPENLISKNIVQRNRGFLAGSFVRPPVDLILQFPCWVDVDSVKLHGKVGSQQTIGVELLAQQTKPGFDPFTFGTFALVTKDYWDVTQVGFMLGLYSRNSRQSPDGGRCDLRRHTLNQRQRQSLMSIYSLRFRITKTANSTIPAVSSLEVWGRVSRRNSPEVCDAVLKRWDVLSKQRPASLAVDTEKNTAQEVPARIQEADTLMIPEEFCDALTCNVMALPVRLPSGNVIDQSTLETFVSNEASWGRPPSDPFTGQPFGLKQKPVHDIALKARIDEFLAQNSHHQRELQNVPRTVGPVLQPEVNLEAPSVSRGPVQQSKQLKVPTSKAPNDPSRRLLTNLASSLKIVTQRDEGRRAVKRPVGGPTSAVKAGCSCGRSDILYGLPCSHHVCRNCLLATKCEQLVRCPRCQGSFPFQQAVRFHGP